jgi:hypothetical protein
MLMVANNICSCAAVFYCSYEGKYADVTWAEKSNKRSADNYRAEILGGCCAQLIVKAAITGRNVAGSAIPEYGCDNMGVVLHGTQHCCPLLEKQAQSDILQYFKRLISTSRIGGQMTHVYGHTDRHLKESQMSLSQRVNIRADLLASEALMTAVVSQTFIVPKFPTEGVSLSIGESRITGSPKQKITHLWGEQVAQDFFHRWKIMNERDSPWYTGRGCRR